jgi:hypothetical protein
MKELQERVVADVLSIAMYGVVSTALRACQITRRRLNVPLS